MGKNVAIILAAGKGTRMGLEISKQFLMLNDKPLFLFAVEAFEKSNIDEIVIVTNKESVVYCENEIKKAGINKVAFVCAGGSERYYSVNNALNNIKEADYVLIHDSARPVISIQVINDTLKFVKEHKACIVAVPVKDTIKMADEEGVIQETLDRKQLWQVQTPQAFDFELIKKAYSYVLENNAEGITDDAMILERYNSDIKIHIVQGNYTNVKVTTIEDLILVKNYLKK